MEDPIELIEKRIAEKQRIIARCKKSREEAISLLPQAQAESEGTKDLMRSKDPKVRLEHLGNELDVAKLNLEIANCNALISLEERQVILLTEQLERLKQKQKEPGEE